MKTNIIFRVEQEWKDKLEAAAEKAGMKVSEYLRGAAEAQMNPVYTGSPDVYTPQDIASSPVYTDLMAANKRLADEILHLEKKLAAKAHRDTQVPDSQDVDNVDKPNPFTFSLHRQPLKHPGYRVMDTPNAVKNGKKAPKL